jgi:hypothetical protein
VNTTPQRKTKPFLMGRKNNIVQWRVKINELGLNKNHVLFLDSQNLYNQKILAGSQDIWYDTGELCMMVQKGG